MLLKDLKEEDVKVGIKVYGSTCSLYGTINKVKHIDDTKYICIEWEDVDGSKFCGLWHPYIIFNNTIVIDNIYYIISGKG